MLIWTHQRQFGCKSSARNRADADTHVTFSAQEISMTFSTKIYEERWTPGELPYCEYSSAKFSPSCTAFIQVLFTGHILYSYYICCSLLYVITKSALCLVLFPSPVFMPVRPSFAATGRQPPPLSSVLYGIIYKRCSVVAAQVLLREKSGA
jgi:hypothetical protein